MVWRDLRLNPGLLGHCRTLYPQCQWACIHFSLRFKYLNTIRIFLSDYQWLYEQFLVFLMSCCLSVKNSLVIADRTGPPLSFINSRSYELASYWLSTQFKHNKPVYWFMLNIHLSLPLIISYFRNEFSWLSPSAAFKWVMFFE